MQTIPLRYQFPKKAIKSDCPECGSKHRRTLSRYVDSRTGDPLPAHYGRCDRESNCGYHLNPYQKTVSNLSYAHEVYERWKEENQPGQTKQWHNYPGRSMTPLTGRGDAAATSQPNQPIRSIPDELFNQSVGHYERNQFARLLRQHFGVGVANDLLNRFCIGTSSRWPGACVFWYIDERGRKRGGQIKLFDQTFHTVKYINAEGKKCSKTSWVHASYAYQLDKKKQPHPTWLTEYMEQREFSPCLFGLSQLQTAPADQPVALVEAPKTAVLCTPYFPQFIWLAVGALSYLKAERLAPLVDREITAFPDASLKAKDSAYGKDFNNWYQKAHSLRNPADNQPTFHIEVSDFLEQRVTDQERADGIDFADCLLAEGKDYPPDWDHPSAANATPILKVKSIKNYLAQS